MTQVKIVVFSDSHGERERMLLAVERERPDAIFHLGDCWQDADDLLYGWPDIPLYRVPGNCDWSMDGQPTEQLVELDGVRCFLCHGHTFSVKSGWSAAVSRAQRERADVLLCGHTHVPRCEDFGYGGVTVLDPGSIRYSHTYGIVTTQRGTALCAIHTME